MKRVAKKDLRIRSFLEELRPPQGKELGSLQLNQNTVKLQEVEDKGSMKHLVQIEVLLLDIEKSQSALISIEGIWVFAGY